MKKAFLMFLLLLPLRAQAQVLTVHNAPDRIVYNTSAEWPYDSFQCHWSAVGANITGDHVDVLGFNPNKTVLDPAHVHLEVSFPRYAEINGPIVVPFTVVLRDFNGTFGVWGAGPYHAADPSDDASGWFWDATQSSTAPAMTGDPNAPMGVQTFTGHFTMHPRSNFHGWDAFTMAGQASFNNGDVMQVAMIEGYWNNVNPNAPVTITAQGPAIYPFVGTVCSPIAANAPGDSFGDNEMFVNDFLPTAPLSGRWSSPLNTDCDQNANNPSTHLPAVVGVNAGVPAACTNSYGGSTLLNTIGSYQTRRDLNFHMGIPGVTVQEIDQTGIIPSPINLDNTGLPVGTHKWGMIRFQPENSLKTNGVASLLVLTTTVPEGGSTAPAPLSVTIPNVVGLTQTVATATLQGNGLQLGTVTQANDSVQPAGNVVNESPMAGTVVNQGTSVNVTISLGPAASSPSSPPASGVAGTVTWPVFGLEDTINGVPQGTFHLCIKDSTHCKPW
ncbi:MAG TPA: PASTA domain-containing protein [Vicinamibacterales bacterium]|nr:PASTA domain-containing protein [Vicinamibacterales bacterium]